MKVGDFSVTHSLRNGAVELDFRQYHKLSLQNRFTLILDEEELAQIEILICKKYDFGKPWSLSIKTYGMAFTKLYNKTVCILGNKNNVSTSVVLKKYCNGITIDVETRDDIEMRTLNFSVHVPSISLSKLDDYIKKIIRELD